MMKGSKIKPPTIIGYSNRILLDTLDNKNSNNENSNENCSICNLKYSNHKRNNISGVT